jgi:tetratricopeptide (TPR) repeat protein
MPSPGTLTQSAAAPAAPKPVPAAPAVPPRPPIDIEVTASRPRTAAVSRSPAAGEADANNVYRQGRRLAEQERFAEAIPLFDQAIQLNPNFTLAYNGRCYANLRLKQYDRAVTDCTEAIRLDASYANAYQNRSVARHFLGDRAGSNEDAKRASAMQPVAQVQTPTPSKQ